jgi:hypothetical protein
MPMPLPPAVPKQDANAACHLAPLAREAVSDRAPRSRYGHVARFSAHAAAKLAPAGRRGSGEKKC